METISGARADADASPGGRELYGRGRRSASSRRCGSPFAKSASMCPASGRRQSPAGIRRSGSTTISVATDSMRLSAARAIELSVQKYCSVLHSLAPDISITHGFTLGSLAVAVALAAPPPVAAQRIAELGVQATALAADPGSMFGGVYGAIRASMRMRVSFAAALGSADGTPAAWRSAGALSPQPDRDPRRRTVCRRRRRGRRWTGRRGLRRSHAGRGKPTGGEVGMVSGSGVGGGARLAAGFRHRWLPPGWPY